MNCTARGLMRPDGAEPALHASTASPPWRRAKASAIWLRLAFSTQTNRTRFFIDPPQQQPESVAQQAPPLATFGFTARGSGLQLAPSVAQGASPPWYVVASP